MINEMSFTWISCMRTLEDILKASNNLITIDTESSSKSTNIVVNSKNGWSITISCSSNNEYLTLITLNDQADYQSLLSLQKIKSIFTLDDNRKQYFTYIKNGSEVVNIVQTLDSI